MRKKTIAALVLVGALSAACSFAISGSEVFENEKFAVKFPGGTADIKSAEWTRQPLFEGDLQFPKYWYKDNTILEKIFQNSPDRHLYSVWESEKNDLTLDERSILKMGLRGLDRVPSTEMKYVTINGQQALDAVYAGSDRTYRSVIFWSDRSKRLYKVEIQAERKEDVSNEDADNFINSFRLKD